LEFFREFEVAFVMRRDTADRSSSVTEQYVIRDPDWNLLPARWVNCVRTGEHACLFFRQIGAFEIAFTCGSLSIFAHSWPLLFGYNLLDERMFGREHQERAAV